MNIVITGFMGTGKTTIGKELAKKLNLKFLDMDEFIERKEGMKINEIFSRKGEKYFRRLEKDTCKEIIKEKNLVVATGGKTLLYERNLKIFLNWGIIVTLFCRPEKIFKRVQNEYSLRPLLSKNPYKSLINIYEKRKNKYMKLPNRIDTTDASIEEVVQRILKMIMSKEKIFNFSINNKKSSVIIKCGLRENLEKYISEITEERKVFILTDKKVFKLYGERIQKGIKKYNPSFFILPPGEKSKNINTINKIYSWLINEKANRKTTLISLGGGVISDLGGFIASTFHRGINLINMPTTLLSQIDASIGGKNGINFSRAKNQIGTFYFPRFILIDPMFCISQKSSQLKEGLIEALKAGIIGDEKLFYLIKNDYEKILLKDLNLLKELIIRAVKVKLSVVKEDPFEENKRRILNLGHTFGHAFESYFDYKITHGRAVGLGILCALKLGLILNISTYEVLEEIKNILNNLNMKFDLSEMEPLEIISYMKFDKKRTGGKIPFIIPKKIGEVVIKEKIDKKLIIKCLEEIKNEENTCH